MPRLLNRDLSSAIARIERADRTLADELRRVRDRGGAGRPPGGGAGAAFLESAPQGPPAEPSGLALETIVLRVGRPVLAVVDGAARLEFADAESEVWRARLQTSSLAIQRAARAVGRINVSGHPQLQWVGTGWLVDDRTVVTNRHVAREFGRRAGGRYSFTSVAGAAIGASIDFLEEIDREDRLEFRIVDIVHLEDETGPDLALLRVEPGAGGPGLAEPIPLSDRPVSPGEQVAVIGYPARDSRIPDYALMQSIFGDVYDQKRLAPGQILSAGPDIVMHDCSTLGGNSGSVVLDLAQGHAVALHFAGRFLEANRAVPAAAIADRVAAARRPGGGHNGVPGSPASGASAPPLSPVPAPVAGPVDTEGDEAFLEGVPADYVGRPGYDSAFVGVDVPLPVILNAGDVLAFPWDGGTEHVLRYQHFSVVMSRARRMCVFSAANIDGGRMRRFRRPGWRLDPRIPSAQQIRHECYGRAPRFSRGHMTRRTDPVWGGEEDGTRANVDSMHVTNTVPQLQPFNAGIWLGLEDYALDHAVEDAMTISVFTGPFLLADDPVRFGVQVPRSFWKIIVFIHDETRELSATGYVMSQEPLLVETEFVFGQHETWQVPVATIERRAGLSFEALAGSDPMAEVEEGTVAPLTDFRQIAWRRS